MKRFLIPLMVVLAALFTTIYGCAEAPDVEQQAEQEDQLRLGEREEQQIDGFRISQLIDSSVQTRQGEELGDVQDVVIDRQGQPMYLVLSGSELDKEDQLVAVPWQAANPQVREDEVTISLSREQLVNAPGFAEDNWAQLEQQQQQINAYFGESAGMQQPRQTQPDMQTQQDTPAQQDQGEGY